jgi:hypothetical protein
MSPRRAETPGAGGGVPIHEILRSAPPRRRWRWHGDGQPVNLSCRSTIGAVGVTRLVVVYSSRPRPSRGISHLFRPHDAHFARMMCAIRFVIDATMLAPLFRGW